jgi:hypothetical protein
MVLVSSTITSTGCIFDANFADYPVGSPAGKPPGAPDDDLIVVQNANNPVVSNGSLKFQPTGGEQTWFFSHPVNKSKTEKRIRWEGRLNSGNGPFVCSVFGANQPGKPFPINPLTLRFSGNQLVVNRLIGSQFEDVHSAPLQPNTPHTISVGLDLQAGTYSVNVTEAGQNPILFSGSLSTFTVNHLKNSSRVVLACQFGPNASSSSEYKLNWVSMHELD